jgi:NADPH:quinone reductase-like Zn-dependent oxidoreductase
MSAIVQDEYGPEAADVLRLEIVDTPVPTDDEVLVRVAAASVDRGTWHVMAGMPYPVRAAGFGLRAPKALNPGRSLAGTIAAVGTKVSDLRVGDEVFGTCDGALAQYACGRCERLASKPVNLDFEQAAAVPVSGLTALQAVRDHAKVRVGERVLIIGASGGVGTFAVQIAKAFGAEVTGVCSRAKVDFVRGLGADHVVDYESGDVTRTPDAYDVILDTGGGARLSALRRALRPRGRLVIVGGENGGRWLGGSDRQVRAMLVSPFVGQRLTTFVASEDAEHLVALRDLIEAGKVAPAVDRTYPLHDVAAAMRHLLEGRARGKIVIRVSS